MKERSIRLNRLGFVRSACVDEKKEVGVGCSYREIAERELQAIGLGELLHYDINGDLWLDNYLHEPVCLPRLVEQFGTPLEIVDTLVVRQRARQWKALTESAKRETGYQGEISTFHAEKANQSAEIVVPMIEELGNTETSSVAELNNVGWLLHKEWINKDVRILCNGYKLPPEDISKILPFTRKLNKNEYDQLFEQLGNKGDFSYAELICLLGAYGVRIIPIVDTGEDVFFGQEKFVPPMEVGVRLKFDSVRDNESLDRAVTRHGMSWPQILDTSERIEQSRHLHLVAFHAMPAAATKTPIEELISSLLFAGEKYFELKKRHPSLRIFDVGGGVPPLSGDYDHQRFLRELMTGMKSLAKKYSLDEPEIVFELGTFLSAESGLTIFKVVQEKINSIGKNGEEELWEIINGSFLATIPDAWFMKSRFSLLAADNANMSAKKARFGGITCNKGDCYHTGSGQAEMVSIPSVPNLVVIPRIGAYQEILSGLRGLKHCLIPEAAELILEDNKGKLSMRVMRAQNIRDIRRTLGYTDGGKWWL